MIVPIVGNTDREFWIGRIYFREDQDRPDPIGNWWGYYGDWLHLKNWVEPFLSGRESYEVFANPWTGEWK